MSNSNALTGNSQATAGSDQCKTCTQVGLLHDDLAGLGAGVSSRISSLGASSKAFMAKVLNWNSTDAPLMRRRQRS